MSKPCCNENRGECSKLKDEKLTDHLPESAGQHHHRCEGSRRVKYERRTKEVKVKADNGNFGEDEEDLFIKLHALLGNRWSLIAGRLPGRTEKQVKNYWNSHLKKKLITMGIDPDNHRPSLPPPPRPWSQQSVACTSGPPGPPPLPPTCSYPGGPGDNPHHENSESSSTSSNSNI